MWTTNMELAHKDGKEFTPAMAEGLTFHHTAMVMGYISRRKPEGVAIPYNGRFGKGLKVYRPSWASTRFCYVDYYVAED